MEDILASIRKILSEDDGEAAEPEPPKAAPPPPPPPPPQPPPPPPPTVMAEPDPEPEPVFEPEPMMMDEPEEPVASILDPEPEEEPIFSPEPDMPLELTGSMMVEEQMQQPMFGQEQVYEPPPYDPNYQHLVSDPVAAASGASIAQLANAVARERAVHLGNHGVTMEQLVRDILNPILKHWLDTNLPYMVERIVKQEIERIVTRSDRM